MNVEGLESRGIVEQRTVIIKWVRMKQVVWHAMLPRWSGRWNWRLALFSRWKQVHFHGVFFYFEKPTCSAYKSLLLSGWFLHFTFEYCSFCGKSHHTPFSTLPPPLKCVAMLRCVTYCILLQRSSAVYRGDTRRRTRGRHCNMLQRTCTEALNCICTPLITCFDYLLHIWSIVLWSNLSCMLHGAAAVSYLYAYLHVSANKLPATVFTLVLSKVLILWKY